MVSDTSFKPYFLALSRKLHPGKTKEITTLGRILLLIIIGFAIYLLFRGFMRSQAKDEAQRTSAREPEDMIACARCGVNLPRSDALAEGNAFVCRDNPRCIAAP